MIIINIFLLIVALILAIITHKQEKLLNEYDKCLKDKGNMQQLMFLANLAKAKGHDIEIQYSTIYGLYNVTLYKKSWGNCWDRQYAVQINNDEELKKIIKEIERLIK
jgi:hypothetical protein